MAAGVDTSHPLGLMLLLRTALYPTHERTPSGFNSRDVFPFCIKAGFEIE